MAWGSSAWGPTSWGSDGEDPVVPLLFAFPVLGKIMAKIQFIASEPLRVIFFPFFDKVANQYVITGLDIATLVVKKPSGSLLTPAPTLVFDSDVNFWVAEIDVSDYLEGDWLVKAVSDAANTLPQYRIFTWGDYVDEVRQAVFGRWKIEGTQLKLYADDGTTVLRTFDLKDSDGNPTALRVFERDPV
jgi:hypothetical protein